MGYSSKGIPSHGLDDLDYLANLVIWFIGLVWFNQIILYLPLADFFSILLARVIHECRREAFETEARRGFSQVRPTQAYW
jgi:hypothetical protein